MSENTITTEAILAAMPGGELYGMEPEDVMWWMTGLSPTKYEMVPNVNLDVWKIIRRGSLTGPMDFGRGAA